MRHKITRWRKEAYIIIYGSILRKIKKWNREHFATNLQPDVLAGHDPQHLAAALKMLATIEAAMQRSDIEAKAADQIWCEQRLCSAWICMPLTSASSLRHSVRRQCVAEFCACGGRWRTRLQFSASLVASRVQKATLEGKSMCHTIARVQKMQNAQNQLEICMERDWNPTLW